MRPLSDIKVLKPLRSFSVLGLYLTASATGTTSSQVTLSGLGAYTGTIVNSTLNGYPLQVPVHAWLGIDYATQPVGSNRFAPVSSLEISNEDVVKNATSYGKVCIQDPAFTSYVQDEACLNLNIYRPVGKLTGTKLPVLIWFHGGSFVSGSGRSLDGAAFVANSKAPLIVVTFNYRVNSLGFLPSKLFEQEGLLNLGLLDQVEMLKFVQSHISSFGGDPDRVTIGGRSAGGHSVAIHYFHNYTNAEPLFSQAILQSGSVTARTFPNASYALYKAQYTEFLDLVDCPDNNTTLTCLRLADISTIRDASSKLYSDYSYAITWPFQPVVGGPLLEIAGSRSGIEGTFYHLPIITTNVNDEGKLFTPGNLTSNQDYHDFLKNMLPDLNSTDLGLLDSLYPDPSSANTSSPYANSPNSTQYNRISAAASDNMYICPGQETAYRTSIVGVPTYKLRFNTNNFFPSWQGIPHTSDTKYTWNDPTTQYPEVGNVLQSYFASFVATGNPNWFRVSGTPEWPLYHGEEGGDAEQLLIEPESVSIEKDGIRREQCAFWRDPERTRRLNK